MSDHVFCAVPELKLLQAKGGKASSTTVLMGAWLGVLAPEDADGWLEVRAFGKKGFVRKEDTSADDRYLKLFFIDVGQGDSCLIEAPGRRLLVDGGAQARNTRNYLSGWKYRHLVTAGQRIRFDAIVVSHFDADHYAGLTSILEDERFEFEAVYHNGIARFGETRAERPAGFDTALGKTTRRSAGGAAGSRILTTSFDSIADAQALIRNGGLAASFRGFLEAAVAAHGAGRLRRLERLTSRSRTLRGFAGPDGLRIQVLGPVPCEPTGRVTYPWFDDESHTINGHSVVLRLAYGERTFLLGGDLNIPAEDYLLDRLGAQPFRVDVAKACHHGASEFTVPFLRAVSPFATVVSSGDNENYSHPRADALGCAGRYSRGERPLVFSTELARSFRTGEDIHYGLINCRTDGRRIVLAQMLEKARSGDMWDAYEV